ncbi:terpene synthase 8 [Artemisia annua]|uniref:Terpene synthase 8 n=1 Tax=Artemisia annua TaxID=35608 RepID=A0A2U1QP01_ARTAN|nr:terpene synthase 8 [Artemisia annua]
MATVDVNANLQVNTKTTIEHVRPLAKFPPSIWGDCFLSFVLDNSKMQTFAKTMEEPKEQLRRMIIDPTIDINEKLNLIYFVYRLGLTYLFVEEIDGQLDRLFNELNLIDYQEADLYTISVHFQVFRTHGYKLSCDVFNKFKDCKTGAFKEDIVADVKGMLTFYESAQLRIREESLLDEAFSFTEAQLIKSLEKTLERNLAQQVKHALETPVHRGHPMVEARLFLIHFEEECSRYDSLVKLAKVHFNYLQLLHKEELRIVSKWWKDMDFQFITPYVRDRVPELYLWILSLFFEPYYSQARIITTKIILLLLVLDDTYDAYATIEEIRLLTDAINRWDVSAMERLPEYIKPFYEILLNEYVGFNKQVSQEGKAHLVDASKQAFQEIARGYLKEAEWRHSGEVPSFEEYIKIGLTTSTHDLLCKSSLIGMGKIVTEEAFTWYLSHPPIMTASELISRLSDDVMTFEFERERAPTATSVDAYIKTNGVSETVAIEELKKMVENAWKDINEGCLKPREVPMDLLAPIVNLARMIEVAYKYNDGFTFPEKTLKEYITLLFQVSVPM